MFHLPTVSLYPKLYRLSALAMNSHVENKVSSKPAHISQQQLDVLNKGFFELVRQGKRSMDNLNYFPNFGWLDFKLVSNALTGLSSC